MEHKFDELIKKIEEAEILLWKLSHNMKKKCLLMVGFNLARTIELLKETEIIPNKKVKLEKGGNNGTNIPIKKG